MARGDLPVNGNPVDTFGTFSIEAQPAGEPDNTLTVRVRANTRLEMTIEPGEGKGDPITLQLNRDSWKMTIREIE